MEIQAARRERNRRERSKNLRLLDPLVVHEINSSSGISRRRRNEGISSNATSLRAKASSEEWVVEGINGWRLRFHGQSSERGRGVKGSSITSAMRLRDKATSMCVCVCARAASIHLYTEPFSASASSAISSSTKTMEKDLYSLSPFFHFKSFYFLIFSTLVPLLSKSSFYGS